MAPIILVITLNGSDHLGIPHKPVYVCCTPSYVPIFYFWFKEQDVLKVYIVDSSGFIYVKEQKLVIVEMK